MKIYRISLGLACVAIFITFASLMIIPKEAHAREVMCTTRDLKVLCSIDGDDPIIPSPYDEKYAEYDTYFYDTPEYNSDTKTGIFYVAYIVKDQHSGYLVKFSANGEASNVVWQQPISAPSTGWATTSDKDPSKTAPPEYTWGKSFNSPICEGNICNSYDDFIAGLWVWALRLAISLSILVVAAAGVVWTTSEGNPDRIGLAKKLIWGVVSGLGLLLLARVLLVDIIGIDASLWKN